MTGLGHIQGCGLTVGCTCSPDDSFILTTKTDDSEDSEQVCFSLTDVGYGDVTENDDSGMLACKMTHEARMAKTPGVRKSRDGSRLVPCKGGICRRLVAYMREHASHSHLRGGKVFGFKWFQMCPTFCSVLKTDV